MKLEKCKETICKFTFCRHKEAVIQAAILFVNEVAEPVIDMADKEEPVYKLWEAVKAVKALEQIKGKTK